MFINREMNIKHICIIFDKNEDHNKFSKNISGRALRYISQELNKAKEKFNMLNYRIEDINCFDGRVYVLDNYKNGTLKNVLSCNFVNVKESNSLMKKNDKNSKLRDRYITNKEIEKDQEIINIKDKNKDKENTNLNKDYFEEEKKVDL